MTLRRRVTVADSGRELGTSYEVALVVDAGAEASARESLAAARAECHRLELILSEWRDDSEISRINQQAAGQPVPLSPMVETLLAGAMHVAQATAGTFDFTWAPLGLLWDEAERRGRLPDDAELAEALRHIGFQKVLLQGSVVKFASAHVRLGVASFAKGWIIDALFHLLRRRGHDHVIVNIGGDLRTTGSDANGRPQAFKVLDPYSPSRAIAELGVVDGSVATSGNYFRQRHIQGRSYGHLFDPATGKPPEFDGSATVLAADAAMADALATALFVMGPERGLAFARRVPGLEALFLTRSGPVATDGLLDRARFVAAEVA